jgi:hypothetical protein
MVVAESAEVEVEQRSAGMVRGVREEGVEHTPYRKQAVTAKISNQQRARMTAGIPRGWSLNQKYWEGGRESRWWDEWKEKRKTPVRRGGSINWQKGCQGGDENSASQKSAARDQKNIDNRMLPTAGRAEEQTVDDV